eukprot:1927860-Alexandrium_andersonii.AAC.1
MGGASVTDQAGLLPTWREGGRAGGHEGRAAPGCQEEPTGALRARRQRSLGLGGLCCGGRS